MLSNLDKNITATFMSHSAVWTSVNGEEKMCVYLKRAKNEIYQGDRY